MVIACTAVVVDRLQSRHCHRCATNAVAVARPRRCSCHFRHFGCGRRGRRSKVAAVAAACANQFVKLFLEGKSLARAPLGAPFEPQANRKIQLKGVVGAMAVLRGLQVV